ncbi:MAG: hypothetical protein RRY12_09760, partial [Cloacibacillus sp.]
VSAIFSINRVAVSYQQAKPRAKDDLRLTMEDIIRFLKMAEAAGHQPPAKPGEHQTILKL